VRERGETEREREGERERERERENCAKPRVFFGKLQSL
jgi:hypothetical protein